MNNTAEIRFKTTPERKRQLRIEAAKEGISLTKLVEKKLFEKLSTK